VKKRLSGALLFAAAFQMMVGLAEAASCGNTGEGFEVWKSTFADEAQTNGTSQKAISALMGTSYSSGTIEQSHDAEGTINPSEKTCSARKFLGAAPRPRSTLEASYALAKQKGAAPARRINKKQANYFL
jgi:membrane-bound lytic murein transglycosylase B